MNWPGPINSIALKCSSHHRMPGGNYFSGSGFRYPRSEYQPTRNVRLGGGDGGGVRPISPPSSSPDGVPTVNVKSTGGVGLGAKSTCPSVAMPVGLPTVSEPKKGEDGKSYQIVIQYLEDGTMTTTTKYKKVPCRSIFGKLKKKIISLVPFLHFDP